MPNNRLLWKIKDGTVLSDDLFLPWVYYWTRKNVFCLYGVILLATTKVFESLVIISLVVWNLLFVVWNMGILSPASSRVCHLMPHHLWFLMGELRSENSIGFVFFFFLIFLYCSFNFISFFVSQCGRAVLWDARRRC